MPRGARVRLPILLGLALLASCATAPKGKSPVAPQAGPAAIPSHFGAGRPAHLLLVSVAGLTTDRYLGETSAMPTLRAGAQHGVAALRVVPVAPAQVYPVHATLITGVPPAVHGVPANRLLGEHGVRPGSYNHASHLLVPTLWQQVLEHHGLVASLDWPTTVGAAIPLLLPDVTPVRAGESWLELLASAASPWMRTRALAADARAGLPGPQRDRFLVDTTCALFRIAQQPRLVLLRLSQTDAAERVHGAWSRAARDAFVRTDGLLGRLTQCLAQAGRAADTVIVVVGDRAILPIHSEVRVNRVLADAGLVVVGHGQQIERWRALARSNGTSAFVYAADEGSALKARKALEAAGRHSGAFRVVSAEQMIARGADREAWFGLQAEPGFGFADDIGRALVAPTRVRGAGGGLLPDATSSPGFVAWGPGLRQGLRIAELRQTDVAPTLARLLGLRLPEAQGRVLVGLLRSQAGASPPAP